MTHYEIGSVANFVSQKSDESNQKKPLQKNQQVLEQLFASSNAVVNTVVAGRGYYNVRLTLLEGLNRLLQRQAARGAVV